MRKPENYYPKIELYIDKNKETSIEPILKETHETEIKETPESPTNPTKIETNIYDIQNKCNDWIELMFKKKTTYTKPGSISHLLFGSKPSDQSINIKMGYLGEFLSKELIKSNNDLELLTCGIQHIQNETKKKDIDILFKNNKTQEIYYLELKGNIQLDTEKLPATIDKCKKIERSLKNTYSEYNVKTGILNWSIYNRQILSDGLSNIKTFENGGITIYHMYDFLQILNIHWKEDDFYIYFRKLGEKIKRNYE